jgi:hypothetical protein
MKSFPGFGLLIARCLFHRDVRKMRTHARRDSKVIRGLPLYVLLRLDYKYSTSYRTSKYFEYYL